MKSLKQLIDNLIPSEVQRVKKLYAVGDKQVSKKLKLFLLIHRHEVSTNEEAMKRLYGRRKTSSAFSHLKERLKNDILDLLMISGADKEMECTRQVLKGKILLERGVIEEGLNQLKRTLTQAKKYELHHVSLSIYNIISGHATSYLHQDQSCSIETECMKAAGAISEIIRARYAVCSMSSNRSGFDLLAEAKMRHEPGEYQALYDKVAFWSGRAKMVYHRKTGRLDAAENQASYLEKHVGSHPDVYTREELAGFNLDLARLFLQQRKYHDAVTYGHAVMDDLDCTHQISQEALRIVFLSHYRNDELEKASAIVQKANETLQGNLNPKNRSVWALYKAGLYFGRDRFKESIDTLQSAYQFLKNEPYWMVSNRLLEILNILELKDYDWLEYKMEAVRKFIFRQPVLLDRYKSIHALIRKFSTAITHPSNSCDQLAALLQNLSDQHPNLLDSEVVDFKNWVRQKALILLNKK